MADYCEFSDLPKDQCAHCRPVPKVAMKRNFFDDNFTVVVKAKFSSRCSCGEHIQEGDDITYSDGEWVGVECCG
jgi:hypothetical protein